VDRESLFSGSGTDLTNVRDLNLSAIKAAVQAKFKSTELKGIPDLIHLLMQIFEICKFCFNETKLLRYPENAY
jgi:hypothetical protein